MEAGPSTFRFECEWRKLHAGVPFFWNVHSFLALLAALPPRYDINAAMPVHNQLRICNREKVVLAKHACPG